MKKNILNSVLTAFLLVVLMSCGPQKVIVKAPPVEEQTSPIVPDQKEETLTMLKAKDLPFTTLSIRGKANLQIDGDENNVSIQLRIQKDQQIWASVTAIAGIEVARALITPDSILVVNRLQKTVLKKPFAFIHDFTSEKVTFGLLQALLTGNTVHELLTSSAEVELKEGVWMVSGQQNELLYQQTFNTLFKVAALTLNDVRSAQALKVVNQQYTPVNQALFPLSIQLNSMAGAKRIGIAISVSKVDANIPLEFPFNAPKNYEVIR